MEMTSWLLLGLEALLASLLLTLWGHYYSKRGLYE